MLFLGAGNLFFKRETIRPGKTSAAARKAELILDSYNRMGCDALNVGGYDLSLGVDYLLGLRDAARFPMLSANLTDQHGKLLFQPEQVLNLRGVRVGVFGLIDPRLKRDRIPGGHKLKVRSPVEAASEAVGRLRDQGAELVILLTNLYGRSLRRVARAHLGIDLIVGSDKRNQISLPVVHGDTFVTHLDRGGKSLGHLEIDPAPGDGGAAVAPAGRGQRAGGRLYRNRFVQLRLEIPDDPEIGSRVAAFEKWEAASQKEQLEKTADADGAGDCGTAYVGAARCATCHPGRYRSWQGTDHAHALESLAARGRQYDLECLACHVLAYECDAGTLKIASVEQFANVQCESCHGPGDLHAASGGEHPTRPRQPVARICLRCHTAERSDGMDFAKAAPRICTDQAR